MGTFMLLRSKVIWGQVKIGWKGKIGPIWKVYVQMEPNLGLDVTWEPSYVNEVKGHIQRSSEVKL